MKLVRPAIIDDDTLISSTAAETVPLYSAATTYALDQRVRSDTTHRQYASAAAGNLNHPLTDPAWWTDIGPTNRWAMFDDAVNSQTIGATGLEVVVQPAGRIDTLAMLNIDAGSVRVVISAPKSGGGFDLVSDALYSMVSDSGIADWYDYFFEPIVRKSDVLIIDNIPLIAAPKIDVTFDSGGASAGVGVMIVGLSREIGTTGMGAGIGITDYSRKDTDAFGVTTIVPRAFARRGTFPLWIDAPRVDEVFRMLSSVRAEARLYIGADNYTSAAIYGFFRNFNIELAYPTAALCTLEIEGLT